MRADIRPQWKRLADWYWEQYTQPVDRHLSIWDVLNEDYGAYKAFNIDAINGDRKMWVIFPDEKSYTAFLLRWS